MLFKVSSLKSQVSSLRSQVSGLESQVSKKGFPASEDTGKAKTTLLIVSAAAISAGRHNH